jgi:REP element-mobilizing transposase RayT
MRNYRIGADFANNFIRVYIHLIWKTWDKLPLITDDVKAVVYRVMLSKAEAMACNVHAIGGVEDHVHVLLSLVQTQTISNVVKELKGASSRIVSVEIGNRFFKWQGTYGAISVSPNALPAVIKYIQNQADHHNRRYMTVNTVEEGSRSDRCQRRRAGCS